MEILFLCTPNGQADDIIDPRRNPWLMYNDDSSWLTLSIAEKYLHFVVTPE